MSRQATSCPISASRIAVARPMERGRAAPVTSATAMERNLGERTDVRNVSGRHHTRQRSVPLASRTRQDRRGLPYGALRPCCHPRVTSHRAFGGDNMRSSAVLRRVIAAALVATIGLGIMAGVAAANDGDKDGSKTGTEVVNLVPAEKQEPGAEP